jgi:Zn-dependent protease with chaperone function
MNFGLLAVGLALLAFPAALDKWANRLPPAEWARVATLALVLGGLSIYAGLVMTTLPPLLHFVQLEGVVGICDPVVHSLMIGGPFLGWVSGLLTVAMTIGAVVALRRSRRALARARVEPWWGHHADRDGYELVVLPTPALIALGVPGRSPQVVVSEGLVDELDQSRLHAVVAHEVAHLRLHHRTYLIVVAMVEHTVGALPVIRRSTRAVRATLEVWADDVALLSERVTEGELASALVAVSGRNDAIDEHALATVNSRVGRLADPVPCLSAAARGLTYLPAGGLLCGAAVLAIGWTLASHQMLNLGGYC